MRLISVLKFTLPLLLFTFNIAVSQSSDSTAAEQPPKKKSPFADTQELTSSDYLAALERANELMNNVRDDGEFRRKTLTTFQEISETNESINLITSNITGETKSNVRNRRMYEKVLLEFEAKLDRYQKILNDDTQKLIGLKRHLRDVMKDTVFRKLVRDSITRANYKEELTPLRAKFFAIDSILKSNLLVLDKHKVENTYQKMVISEALVIVSNRLDKTGFSILKVEHPNLWDTEIKIRNQNISSFIAEKFFVEMKAFTYYFKYSLPGTISLVLLLVLLYWWI
ncbi:MAG TPA: hypothetical protein VGB43_04345, partial [Flavobacterium sp.]